MFRLVIMAFFSLSFLVLSSIARLDAVARTDVYHTIKKEKGLLWLRGHEKHITALVFSPDGKILASAGNDGDTCIWDVVAGKLLHRLPLQASGVYSLAYSPDGKILATGAANHKFEGSGLANICLWDPVAGKEIRKLEGHESTVAGLAFSPDGKILASGSYDSTIRLWDPASGKELRQMKGHQGRVTGVAFTADGKQLLSGGVVYEDLKVRASEIPCVQADFLRLWDVASAKEIRKLESRGSAIVISADGTLKAGAGRIMDLQPAGGGISVNALDVISIAGDDVPDRIRSIKHRGANVSLSTCGLYFTGSSRIPVGEFYSFGSMLVRILRRR